MCMPTVTKKIFLEKSTSHTCSPCPCQNKMHSINENYGNLVHPVLENVKYNFILNYQKSNGTQ